VSFKVPDVYGIYQFKINHKRRGNPPPPPPPSTAVGLPHSDSPSPLNFHPPLPSHLDPITPPPLLHTNPPPPIGYTTIHVAEQVSVRPFRHNEYERFIVAAYPYYASALASMAATFLFGLAFLYHRSAKSGEKKD
jgi:hypothetical protein